MLRIFNFGAVWNEQILCEGCELEGRSDGWELERKRVAELSLFNEGNVMNCNSV